MVLAVVAVRRDEGVARPLAYGVLLTIAAMMLLLPYQGHGWGYRYLHGLIGSCALLGAYGWRHYSQRREVQSFVVIGSVATLLGSLPFLMWQTHKFVDPYARVNRMIETIPADMVVVETEGTSFAIDEVRNQPDLSNRPIRLAGKSLTPADIRILCRRGSIAFVDVLQMHSMGLGVVQEPSSSHFSSLRSAAQDASCARTA
jgi:peptidoglycan/LPS O-acetylase OafA/YrhL